MKRLLVIMLLCAACATASAQIFSTDGRPIPAPPAHVPQFSTDNPMPSMDYNHGLAQFVLPERHTWQWYVLVGSNATFKKGIKELYPGMHVGYMHTIASHLNNMYVPYAGAELSGSYSIDAEDICAFATPYLGIMLGRRGFRADFRAQLSYYYTVNDDKNSGIAYGLSAGLWMGHFNIRASWYPQMDMIGAHLGFSF